MPFYTSLNAVISLKLETISRNSQRCSFQFYLYCDVKNENVHLLSSLNLQALTWGFYMSEQLVKSMNIMLIDK